MSFCLGFEFRVNRWIWGVLAWINCGLISWLSGFCCCVSVLMIWVINLAISGWFWVISVGLGEDFRENPVSDLGLGVAALLEASQGWERRRRGAPLAESLLGSFWSPFRGVCPGFVWVIARGLFWGFKITCLSCLDIYFGLWLLCCD